MLNSEYPYKASDGTCKYSSSKGKVKTVKNSSGSTYYDAGNTSGNAT